MQPEDDHGAQMHVRAGDPPLRVSREIPLPWLIGAAVGLIFNAAVMWLGLQSVVSKVGDMTVEIKEQRAGQAAMSLQLVELKMQSVDHERRIQSVERSKP